MYKLYSLKAGSTLVSTKDHHSIRNYLNFIRIIVVNLKIEVIKKAHSKFITKGSVNLFFGAPEYVVIGFFAIIKNQSGNFSELITSLKKTKEIKKQED